MVGNWDTSHYIATSECDIYIDLLFAWRTGSPAVTLTRSDLSDRPCAQCCRKRVDLFSVSTASHDHPRGLNMVFHVEQQHMKPPQHGRQAQGISEKNWAQNQCPCRQPLIANHQPVPWAEHRSQMHMGFENDWTLDPILNQGFPGDYSDLYAILIYTRMRWHSHGV